MSTVPIKAQVRLRCGLRLLINNLPIESPNRPGQKPLVLAQVSKYLSIFLHGHYKQAHGIEPFDIYSSKLRSVRADAGIQASSVAGNAAINKLASCIAVVAVSASTLPPSPRTCMHRRAHSQTIRQISPRYPGSTGP